MECSPGRLSGYNMLRGGFPGQKIGFTLFLPFCTFCVSRRASISYLRRDVVSRPLSICLGGATAPPVRMAEECKVRPGVFSVIRAQWRNSPAFSRRASHSVRFLADPSAVAISPSRLWILIQMHLPGLSLADVGAPSNTVLLVYSLMHFFFPSHELKS